jgi:hypothetical protein
VNLNRERVLFKWEIPNFIDVLAFFDDALTCLKYFDALFSWNVFELEKKKVIINRADVLKHEISEPYFINFIKK